jgi:hypothetical protein
MRLLHKPWFNKDCRQKRNAFHKIKNKYRNNKTIETKTLLNSKAKEFRNELNKWRAIESTKLNVQMNRYHCKTNPKAYWRTLKKFSGNDKQNPPISQPGSVYLPCWTTVCYYYYISVLPVHVHQIQYRR